MHRSDPRRGMIAFDFPRVLLVTLFTVALTSSVNARRFSSVDDWVLYDKSVASKNSANNSEFEQEYQIGKTAQSPKNSEHHTEPVQNATKQDFSAESNTSAIVHSSEATNNKTKMEWAEGGLVPVSFSTIQHKNTVTNSTAAIESDKPNESRTRENVPKERNANPSVVPKKGAERKKKIHSRKGVNETVDSDINHATSEYAKSVETSSVTEAAHINNQTETSNITISKLDASSSRSNNSLDHNVNLNNSSTTLASTNTTILHAKTNVVHNATTIAPKTSSHIPKPKPTVTTVDGPEVNESIPSSRTKNSSLGMPRKIDYIAPVIITIIALPILGAAIFMLYRRGRDCWDKRHYRRMDFLIDGMYND
nr:PREDICTED: putative uncharacterized protein DDB_G0282133 [Linepithema humile]